MRPFWPSTCSCVVGCGGHGTTTSRTQKDTLVVERSHILRNPRLASRLAGRTVGLYSSCVPIHEGSDTGKRVCQVSVRQRLQRWGSTRAKSLILSWDRQRVTVDLLQNAKPAKPKIGTFQGKNKDLQCNERAQVFVLQNDLFTREEVKAGKEEGRDRLKAMKPNPTTKKGRSKESGGRGILC